MLCWLQSAGEAFWRLQPSSMAASRELSLPARSQIQSAPLLFAFTLLRFLGAGSLKQMPSPQPGWARPCQLPSLLAAESLPGCRVQGPGTMTSSISYFNAEFGTQSLLKINTKENSEVAKPILIPFIFLVPSAFVFPLQLGGCISHGAHPEYCQGSHPCPVDSQTSLDHWLEQSPRVQREEKEENPTTISLSAIYIKQNDGTTSKT